MQAIIYSPRSFSNFVKIVGGDIYYLFVYYCDRDGNIVKGENGDQPLTIEYMGGYEGRLAAFLQAIRDWS